MATNLRPLSRAPISFQLMGLTEWWHVGGSYLHTYIGTVEDVQDEAQFQRNPLVASPSYFKSTALAAFLPSLSIIQAPLFWYTTDVQLKKVHETLQGKLVLRLALRPKKDLLSNSLTPSYQRSMQTSSSLSGECVVLPLHKECTVEHGCTSSKLHTPNT